MFARVFTLHSLAIESHPFWLTFCPFTKASTSESLLAQTTTQSSKLRFFGVSWHKHILRCLLPQAPSYASFVGYIELAPPKNMFSKKNRRICGMTDFMSFLIWTVSTASSSFSKCAPQCPKQDAPVVSEFGSKEPSWARVMTCIVFSCWMMLDEENS